MKMKSYLRRNYPIILCHVRDVEQGAPDIRNIPVVNEYTNVLPSKIPGLPPKRLVDLREW